MGANSDPPHMRRTSVAVNLQIDWRELKPYIACSFYEPYAVAADLVNLGSVFTRIASGAY